MSMKKPVSHRRILLSPSKVQEKIESNPKLTARLTRLQEPAEKALHLMGREVSQS